MARNAEEIRRDVTEQLCWDDRVDASNITVEVENGTVTLGGTVPTYFADLAAVNDTWAVRGVTEVRDNISVRYPRVDSPPTDDEIRERVVDVLMGNPDIHIAEIGVNVTDGLATLEGSVDAYWKKYHAEHLVSGCAGVVEVDNELAIVPSRTLTDQDIAAQIIAAIERNALLEADRLNVRVLDGYVTLSGTAPSAIARRLAYEAALYTPGVRGVRNEIAVMAPAPAQV
jgi:osmotically-inducible protein OsmY